MSTNNIGLHARIIGRVQGVGFRWWTRQQAERLGLRGTVRNRSDGSVEVHAAGEARAVERFRGLLAEGPAAAEVRRVELLPRPDGERRDGALPDGFEIRR